MIDKFTLFSGVDIPIPELRLILRQPTLKDIAYIGEENFFKYLSLLNFNKNIILQATHKEMFKSEEDYNEYINLWEQMNRFETLMALLAISSEEEREDIVNSISILFLMLLPDYKIEFDTEALELIGKDNVVIVRSEEFDILLNTINTILCWDFLTQGELTQDYDPADELAAKIAEKLRKGRQRIKGSQHNEKNISLFTNYTKMLYIGLGISMDKIMDLTIIQLLELAKKFQEKIAYESEERAIIAGAKPSENFKHWIQPD